MEFATAVYSALVYSLHDLWVLAGIACIGIAPVSLLEARDLEKEHYPVGATLLNIFGILAFPLSLFLVIGRASTLGGQYAPATLVIWVGSLLVGLLVGLGMRLAFRETSESL